ncbi:MAG: YfiR family protein [Paraglaciecola polaris]|uniref:YfiR family protein n=1 Tax=Paraglaciecola polaris TaxID=222814 RepID=UPI0030039C70
MSWVRIIYCFKRTFLFFLLLAPLSLSAQELPKERKLKAAYLLNFTKYLTWPEGKINDRETAFRLCVNSDPSFFAFMQALVVKYNQSNAERKIALSHVNNATHCHMAYLQTPVEPFLPQITRAVIVLESLDVQQSNSAIRFYTQANKVRFEFDLAQLANVQVKASSELLKLARIAGK